MSVRVRNGWVFSRNGDLLAFGGPLLLAGGIVLGFHAAGALDADVPPWLFALLIVGCDVAHVWATLYRTYLDPEERRRRPATYVLVPVGCLLAGIALHSAGSLVFWRALAYLAAFHFVRQQWGWMAYSARKAGETSRLDRLLDEAAIYAATVFPLLWWHANLPRAFVWFTDGDFARGTPTWVGDLGLVLHFGVLGLWVLRQAFLGARGRPVNLAKGWILLTTWLAWFGGIVVLDSDVAFTATNVLAHGIPYFVLVHRWGRARYASAPGFVPSLFRPRAVLAFYGVLAAIAFVEEGLWDRLVWGQNAALYALPAANLDASLLSVVVPLLAVPQATHYVLDALLWRTSAIVNPGLADRLGLPTSTASRTG